MSAETPRSFARDSSNVERRLVKNVHQRFNKRFVWSSTRPKCFTNLEPDPKQNRLLEPIPSYEWHLWSLTLSLPTTNLDQTHPPHKF